MNSSFPTALERRLGYAFRDRLLLEMALTRRGARRGSGVDNERLEFLGDAVLGLVVAADLYQRFPEARESEMTRARSQLVRRETLAEIGETLGVAADLQKADSDRGSGAAARESMVADAVEALIGAVYLESGLEQAYSVVVAALGERLSQPPRAVPKDPKTALQEWLQGRARPLPQYTLESQQGPAHAPEFEVRVLLTDGDEEAHASGTSRRGAEQAAAQAMLDRLGVVLLG